MNFKTTIVLLILLIGAGVFLLVEKYHGSSSGSSQQNAEGGTKLFDVDADDVNSLQFVPGPELHRAAVSLVRRDGDWEMTQPLPAKADKFKVDGLLRQVLDLRATASLDAASESGSKGLEPPRLTVVFSATTKDKQGKTIQKTYKLGIGDRSPLGNMMYVQPEGSKKIDVVAADVYDDLLQPTDALRDTQLVTASSADIRHVEIDRPKGKLVLNKVSDKNGDHWEITSPQSMPGDAGQVTDLLAAITGLHASAWVPKDSPEAKLAGVDHPRITVSFSSAAPEASLSPATAASTTQPAKVVTIKFGRYEDVLHQAVFATISTSPYLVKVPAMPLETFEQPALDFRDRSVLDIDPAEVSRITLDVGSPAPHAAGRAFDRHTIVVVRAQAGAEVPPLIAAPGYRSDSATALVTEKRMDKYELSSARKRPEWFISSQPVGIASTVRMTSLLDKLHPLYAEHYLAENPVTQPAEAPGVYVLHVTAQASGGAKPKQYDLRIIDRGPAEMPVGEYNGLTFELSHSLVNTLEGNFSQPPKKETPPNGSAPEEGFPGGPPPDMAR